MKSLGISAFLVRNDRIAVRCSIYTTSYDKFINPKRLDSVDLAK